jgi:hypothetical protein
MGKTVSIKNVRFEVFMLTEIQAMVLWVMTLCSDVTGY